MTLMQQNMLIKMVLIAPDTIACILDKHLEHAEVLKLKEYDATCRSNILATIIISSNDLY